MPNQHASTESAQVSPAWVERELGISRSSRLDLEARGILHPTRYKEGGHRRYNRAEVEALRAKGAAALAAEQASA